MPTWKWNPSQHETNKSDSGRVPSALGRERRTFQKYFLDDRRWSPRLVQGCLRTSSRRPPPGARQPRPQTIILCRPPPVPPTHQPALPPAQPVQPRPTGDFLVDHRGHTSTLSTSLRVPEWPERRFQVLTLNLFTGGWPYWRQRRRRLQGGTVGEDDIGLNHWVCPHMLSTYSHSLIW